jgi:glycosyltransferase involved in cell wall biosynthesis
VVDLAHQSPERPVPVITWFSRDNSLAESKSQDIDLIPLRPFSVRQFARATNAIRNADVVHAHLFPTQYLAALLPRPVIFTEHNTWNRRRDRPWLRPVERWSYARFAKVVAISDEVGRALAVWLGRPPPRLETIPNGIRLDRFSAPPRTPPTSGDFVIGMAARFSVEKDHETIIRAVSLLPVRYRLRLAGDGPLKEQFKELARTLGIADRVDFPGVARDMPEFFRSLDAYVQSSRFDGFSIVAVEAMASGLPTIASDIDGLRDTIGEPRALFVAANATALADLVRALAESPDLYRLLSGHAVAQAAKFDIVTTARRYASAYAAVAGCERNGGSEREPEKR